MESISQFQTVNHFVQMKHTIHKSRFIVSVQEVKNEEESRYFLKSIIKQFPDATHHCWAYRFGNGKNEVFQYSDDGEPTNSAGPPILQAIRRENVTNVMIVVTRYFGGNKLGISGLIQAYRNISLEGLRSAGKKKMLPLREFIIKDVDYQALGKVLQSLESQSGHILGIDYGRKVKVLVCLPGSLDHWVTQMVENITRGNANIHSGEIRWYNLDG